MEGNGHETLTLYDPEDGKYKYSVVNYSRGSKSLLGSSKAHVQLYIGKTNTTYNFYVPKGDGYTWDVFEYNEKTGGFRLLNLLH